MSAVTKVPAPDETPADRISDAGVAVSLKGAAQSWSMNYAPDPVGDAAPPPLALLMNAAKSDDPTEDEALALWSQGRKEEAIALLEKQIAREREAASHIAAAPAVVVPPAAAEEPVVAPAPVVASPAAVAPAVVAAPPVTVAPAIAAQALTAPRAGRGFRYVGAGALALAIVAAGAVAVSNREQARAVLADAGIVEAPQAADAGGAMMADAAAPPAAEKQEIEIGETAAPIGSAVPDAGSDAFQDETSDDVAVAATETGSAADDPGITEAAPGPDVIDITDPLAVDDPPSETPADIPEDDVAETAAPLVMPAESDSAGSTPDEGSDAVAAAESAGPVRQAEDRADAVIAVAGSAAEAAGPQLSPRAVRQVGEEFATGWPAGTGSAPPRLVGGTPSPDMAPAEAVPPPPAMTEAQVAALTGVEDAATTPVSEGAGTPAAPEAVDAAPPPEAVPGATPAPSTSTAVPLPPGHFEFAPGAASPDGTPLLTDLASRAPVDDADVARVPRARPQPTAAAYRQVPPPEPSRNRPRRVVVAEAYDPPPPPQRVARAEPPVVWQPGAIPPSSAYDQALADGYVIIQQDRARYFRPRPGRVYVVPAPPPQPYGRVEIIGRVPGW